MTSASWSLLTLADGAISKRSFPPVILAAVSSSEGVEELTGVADGDRISDNVVLFTNKGPLAGKLCQRLSYFHFVPVLSSNLGSCLGGGLARKVEVVQDVSGLV